MARLLAIVILTLILVTTGPARAQKPQATPTPSPTPEAVYVQVLISEQTLRQAKAQVLSLLLSGHQALDALEAAVNCTLDGDTR